MSDERIEVLFGAQIASLLSGLGEATAGVRESVGVMKESFEELAAVEAIALGPIILITAALTAMAGVGVGLIEAASSAAELGKELEIGSQKTGMAAEELSKLRYAADLSDVSASELTVGLQRLARGMEQAEKGSGPAAAALKTLGINAVDSSGHLRPMNDVLLDVAAKFAGMEDGAGKTALAMDLFGRSGANLIPLLNQGAGGIAALKAQADQLGVTMGGRDVAAANEYVDTMKEFHQVMGALGRELGLVVMPVLIDIAKWAEKVAEKMILLLRQLRLLKQDLTSALAKDPSLDASLFGPKTPAPPQQGKNELMQQLEASWLAIKEGQRENFGSLTQLELSFWQSKLHLAEQGSQDYLEIRKKIVGLEEQLSRQSYEGELAALHAKEQADKDDLAAVVADRKAELAIIRQHYPELSKEVQDGIARVNEAQDALLKQTAKQWEDVFNAIPTAFTTAMQGIGKNVNSMRDLFRQFFTDLTKMSLEWGATTLRNHIAVELAKRDVTAAGVAERVALETWGALQSVAKNAWAALISIGNYAAQAIAATWASISAIPFVGPFLAPAVAVGVGAAVIGLAGNVRSAAGGYDIPAGVNPMTQLHAQEMVLPAELANRIRGMAGNGGGGGDTHLHVHAIDAKGVRQFLMDNRDHVADAARRAVKDGRSSTRRA
jgi:hypothetical protein